MGIWVIRCAVATLVLAAVTACGSDGACSDFAVSQARTSQGAASAVEAARDLSATGGFTLPVDGWTPSGLGTL